MRRMGYYGNARWCRGLWNIGVTPSQRKGYHYFCDRKVSSYKRWGDGYWSGLGYWKVKTRKGYEL